MKGKKMKIQSVIFATTMSGLVTLCSCSQEVMNNEEMERDSRLTVLTRSDGMDDGTVIATPVRLYVFNQKDECVAVQDQEDASTPVSVELARGVYDVYAIGGADESLLALPSQADAAKTSVVTLKEGQTLGDLMTAHSTVTLNANGTNTLTLGMERKVCQIVGVTINNVPEDVEEVSVSISPLHESILLNGEYQGESGRLTIPLKRQDNSNTWKEQTSDIFLFPSVGKPTISVMIGNSTYSYTCLEEIANNYKISIEGNYTGEGASASVTLTGTFTGVSWLDEKAIRFNFSEDGSEIAKEEGDDQTEVIDAPVPEVGTLYEGCYVLAVNGKQATVLSSKTEKGIIQSGNNNEQEVSEALENWSVPNITATWELINDDILDLMAASLKKPDFPSFNSKYVYLYTANAKVKGFDISGGEIHRGNFTPSSGSYLRPVATLTFK